MNKRKRQQRNWQMRYEDSMCPRSRYRRALIRAMQQLCVVMIFSVASLTNDALASEGKHASLTQPEQAASGSLLFRQAEQGVVAYQQAPRLNTDINLAIVGEFVRATVRQRFVNPTDDWVEGVYVFPLPDDAAIDHLTLVIGEQRIVGEIHRRKDAKRIYNTARASGRKAALLSQERPNLFTTAVANIAPRETIEVEIEYQQTVQRAGASHHIRVPLTMTPRFMPGTPLPTTLDKTGSGWSPATDQVLDAQRISPPVIADGIRVSDHRVSLSMSLDAGQPLASLTSRYHPVDVTAIGGTRYTATLKYADELADHDLEIEWQLAESDTALTPAFTHRDESGGYLLARIMPPTLKHVAANIPRSLILVLDTSGSMEGVSLAQAKAAAEYAIDTLEEGDRFNIIEFNSSARALFDVARTASPENKQFAL
ncbi:MAG: VIT domain-containing protein, partial [Pseudomonadota bacterium]